MSSSIILGASIVVFLLAYLLFGQWLKRKQSFFYGQETPAHTRKDETDFVPAKGPVLFGFQFASAAGIGILAGPVAGAAFGWLPALLWIIIGGIFIGGILNFNSLLLPIQSEDKTLGGLVESLLGRKIKMLFLTFAWASAVCLTAAFTKIMAGSLSGTGMNEKGEAMISSANGSVAMAVMLMIPLSIAFGYFNQKKKGIVLRTLLGIFILAVCIGTGFYFPLYGGQAVWTGVILLILYVGAVTPVWLLVQPLNYLGSFLLYILLAIAAAGIFWMDPQMNLPAVNGWQADGNLLFPFLFLLSGSVVCGYHGLISSEITGRQLNRGKNAKSIGYGASLLGSLAAVAVLAAAGSTVQDLQHLQTETPFTLFVSGAASFLEKMGLGAAELNLVQEFILLGLGIAVFSSLNILARLGRTLFQELAAAKNKKKRNILEDKYLAGGITIAAVIAVVLTDFEGDWEIFGICSSVIAAFLFLIFACWRKERKKGYRIYILPFLFLNAAALGGTGILLKEEIFKFAETGNRAVPEEIRCIFLGLIGAAGTIFLIKGILVLLRKTRKEESTVKKIIFATGNEDKMREIREILADTDWQVESMKEAGIEADIVEDGKSFEENAVIKAKTICELTGEIVLADDSGLEIDYLNKEPGIYSARYMGEDTSYHIKNAKLIERLEGVEDEKRTARFVCAIAAAFPDGTVKTVRETMEGRIGYEEKGENGFGYDPIFYLPEYGCTSSELSREEKNKISHRGKALRAIKKELV